MIVLIERPLSAPRALGLATAVAIAGSVYCILYNRAAGVREPPLVALGWGLANLVPWVLAFEAAKALTIGVGASQARFWLRVASVLCGALALSLLIEAAIGSATDPWLFRLVRRLPGAALVVALLLGGRAVGAMRLRYAAVEETPPADLPVPPQMIERVTSAGNYVEVHFGGRQLLCRLTMRRAQALLASHGFLRIHRTTLVNRRRIVRVIAGKIRDEIVMDDGCRLSVGGRYRSMLAGLR